MSQLCWQQDAAADPDTAPNIRSLAKLVLDTSRPWQHDKHILKRKASSIDTVTTATMPSEQSPSTQTRPPPPQARVPTTPNASNMPFRTPSHQMIARPTPMPLANRPSKSSQVEVVVLDSDEEETPPPAMPSAPQHAHTSPKKRPRSPLAQSNATVTSAVIDVDDDEQLELLARTVKPRVVTRRVQNPQQLLQENGRQPLRISGAVNAQPYENNELLVGKGGGMFTIDGGGAVNIVDSDDEADLRNRNQIFADESGLRFVREMDLPSSEDAEEENGAAGWQASMTAVTNNATNTPIVTNASAPGVAERSGSVFLTANRKQALPVSTDAAGNQNVNVASASTVPAQNASVPMLNFANGVESAFPQTVVPHTTLNSYALPQQNAVVHPNVVVQPNGVVHANGVVYSNAVLQTHGLQSGIPHGAPQQPMLVPINQAGLSLPTTNAMIAPQTQQVRFGTVPGVNAYEGRPDFRAVPASSGSQPATAGASHLGHNSHERAGLSFGYVNQGNTDNAMSNAELKKILKQNEITADATEEAETPCQMNVELMAHQKRALAWMTKRERPIQTDEDLVVVDEECLGGILADDQGLGKTLSMIALLVNNPPDAELPSSAVDDDIPSDANDSNDSDDSELDSDSDFIDDGPIDEPSGIPWRTLIVCPVSLLNQWKEEIETKLKDEYVPSVYIYHGSNRTRSWRALQKYDVVITTYSVLTNEYPKVQRDHKEYQMRKQEKLALPKRDRGPVCKVHWHRVVLDEAQYVKNRTTDAWSAAMSLEAEKRWCLTGTPIQNSVDDLFSLFCFIRYRFVQNYEMWNLKWKKKLESTHSNIRKKAFQQFQTITGVVLLRRTKKDAISGKPLIALPSRTVKIDQRQFADADERTVYFAVQERSVLTVNKFLAEGTLSANYSTVLLALLRMRQACCHPFLIQYSQMQSRHGSRGEIDGKYSTTYSQEELEEALELANDGHSLLGLIEEHARERLYKALEPPQKPQAPSMAFPCSWCRAFTSWTQGFILGCGDMFCRNCCRFVKERRGCIKCPHTIIGVEDVEALINADHIRREVHANVVFGKSGDSLRLSVAEFKELMEDEIERRLQQRGASEPRSDSSDDDVLADDLPVARRRRSKPKGREKSMRSHIKAPRQWRDPVAKEQGEKLLSALSQHSTKISVIIEELNRTRQENPGEKTLIFSQWTSFLDIIEFHVRLNGHEVCRLDGSMAAAIRQKQVREFRESKTKNVFLISLSAGGTGLNLTASNRVILTDVWWNPAAEEQAIDRVHRIGQTRPVYVKRFKMAETVEEKIYAICERKRQMADGTLGVVGQQNLGRTKMSMRELMSLFSGAIEEVARNAEAGSAAAQARNNFLRYQQL